MGDDYSQFLGTVQGVPQAPLDPSYAAMMQPQPDFSMAQRPAANPQELERRMTGWAAVAHKFQTDPNLQRAMMMTGAALMQPVQPGQTPGGATANAAVVGLNAYSMGQEADFARQAAMAKEGRAERGLGLEERRVAESEATGATNRAATEARTEGTLLDTEIKQEQKGDLIKRGQALAEKAVAELKDYKDAEGARRAERAITEQKARILESIPDAVLQQAELDKVNALSAKLDQLKAQTEGVKAKTEGQRLENEGQASLTPSQRAAAAASKSSTGNTAIEAGRRVYTDLWNTDPALQKRYPNVSSYIDERLSGKKRGGAIEDLAAYQKAYENEPEKADPEILKFLQDQVKKELGVSGGTAPNAGPASDKKGKKPPPKVGEVIGGHRFKGGDPNKPESWEKVQ